jgi:putative tricarboxylic transport membrane protein
MRNPSQTLIGVGVLAVGGLLGAGAIGISSVAGYAGVGPNFLPWVVGGSLALCGAFLIWEALSGGFRAMGDVEGADHGYWPGFAWVSVGILVNAALIAGFEIQIGPLQLRVPAFGFVLSCAICFVLAARGFKSAEGRIDRGLRGWALDAAVGLAIAAPVYWMFTQLLAINLPGLTSTGWL